MENYDARTLLERNGEVISLKRSVDGTRSSFRERVLQYMESARDSGNELRYLGWSFVELFTRRSDNPMPSFR